MPGVQVQTVADALDIHPFMLSRWRKEAREGILKGRARRGVVEGRRAREIKRLQALEREHAMLREELLKKAIRFCSERRRRSSSSLIATAGASQ
jgi:transposase